jgi:GDYXXLXY protein
MTKKTALICLVAFQCLILVGMFAKAFYPLAVGHEVRLQVIPRDPRDLMRGDYVDLAYTFSQLNYRDLPNDVDSTKTYRFGDVLYLELKKVGEFHEPAGLWLHPPSGKTFLRVTPEYSYPGQMNLKAGIESYFTDSKNAQYLETATGWGSRDSLLVSVSIMLTDGGIGRIKDLAVKVIPRSPEGIRADSILLRSTDTPAPISDEATVAADTAAPLPPASSDTTRLP